MRKNNIIFYSFLILLILIFSIISLWEKEGIIYFTVGGIIFAAGFFIFIYFSKCTSVKKRDAFYILIIMIIAGVAARILLAMGNNFHTSDMACFTGWANIAYREGLSNFYTSGYFADYPPLYMYILYFIGYLNNAIPSFFMEFAIKIPAIICDVILAVFIYSIAKKHLKNYYTLILCALVLLNPAVMINSAMWGQIDSIYTLFMVLTVYLLYKNNISASIIVFLLSLLLKPQAVLAAPVIVIYIIYLLVTEKEKVNILLNIFSGMGIGISLCALLILPFSGESPFSFIIKLYSNTFAGHSYIAMNGFNLFAALGFNWVPLTENVRLIGYILIVLVCIFSAYIFYKNRKIGKNILFLILAYIIFGVYIFSHSMHERYTFAVPLLILFAFIFMKNKKQLYLSLILFITVIIDHSVALYHYGIWISYPLTLILSVKNIAIFVYFTYIILTLKNLKEDVCIKKSVQK